MKVTRDVIYDLLPAYFAGEVSADTRALIEEFFSTDPELRRMAERFRAMADERRGKGAPDTEADREKQSFDRLKARMKLRLAAVVWALGALLAVGIGFLTVSDRRFGIWHPGVIIGIVFGASAVFTWLTSLSSNPERWYARLTDPGHRDR